jgi:sensor c-di-GMP phosphodiesterase-like protein
LRLPLATSSGTVTRISLRARVDRGGVEQRDQLELLEQLGCDSVQGYVFAKPMPGAEFVAALMKVRSYAIPRALAQT